MEINKEKIEFKNAKELSEYEFDSLIDVYEQYFKDLTGRPFGSWPNTLRGFFERFFSRDYAKRMPGKIFSDDVICFTAVENEVIRGFITGRTLENNEAWISHFHTSKFFSPKERRLVEAQLFGLIASEFKKRGVCSVYTEAEYNPHYKNTLNNLGFENQGEIDKGVEEFKKNL